MQIVKKALSGQMETMMLADTFFDEKDRGPASDINDHRLQRRF